MSAYRCDSCGAPLRMARCDYCGTIECEARAVWIEVEGDVPDVIESRPGQVIRLSQGARVRMWRDVQARMAEAVAFSV